MGTEPIAIALDVRGRCPTRTTPRAAARAVVFAAGLRWLMVWAGLAPLDEAIPAERSVAVESSHKRVDHLNGGLIEQILVREGQTVREGDELLVLNATQSQSALNATQGQFTAMATWTAFAPNAKAARPRVQPRTAAPADAEPCW